jgi:hypothetical protein
MDKVDYLEEANRKLTDERFYKKLDSDPTEEFSTKITQELKIIKENSHEKCSLIRRDLAYLSRSADSCSSLILLGVGQKLSPLLLILLYQNTVHNLEVLDKTITNIKTALNKSLTFSATVSFWSLLISLCLENLHFRLVVSPEVTDNADGIFLFGLIPSLYIYTVHATYC